MSAALCVTVLCVVAGCAAALPQQQEQDLRSINSRLESRLEALELYVTSRLDSLAARLDSHESRLEDLSDSLTEAAPASRSDGTADATTRWQTYPRDCSQLPAGSPSGTYLLQPRQNDSQAPPVRSRCDMDTDGGGWTVIQNRAHDIQPEQDFNLGWAEYKLGFGNITGEFWWGLDNMWQLTSAPNRQYELRIDLEAFDGEQAYAIYSAFGVSSEQEHYRLRGEDTFREGPAGDGLKYHAGGVFMTSDRNPGNAPCEPGNAPWWYGRHCYFGEWVNLNGRRLPSPTPAPPLLYPALPPPPTWDFTGIAWLAWRESQLLKGARMMIRPVRI